MAIAFVLLASVHVVRTAGVAAFAEERPAAAIAVWPGHPDVLLSVAMAEVGEAAAAGATPPPDALRRLEQLARVEPLAAQPFLVHSAIAQKRGDFARAERLLVQARDRDPRSPAARFLLADLYFRSGRISPGLAEMTVLARLMPGGIRQVAPSLAAFATSAGAAPHLRRILLIYPELQPALLNQLAEDPRNADLILAIAGPTASADGPPDWQEKLLDKLVEQGSYARAQAVWARLSGIPQEENDGLFNPRFAESSAPPPFNWALESSAKGVAEPADGGLRILYYGRDNVALASQLMLLPAGRYQLRLNVSGEAGEGSEIGWTLTCLPSERRVLDLPLGGQTAGGAVAGAFTVPGEGCTAQRLELRGVGKEFPETANLRIANLQLTRIGG